MNWLKTFTLIKEYLFLQSFSSFIEEGFLKYIWEERGKEGELIKFYVYIKEDTILLQNDKFIYNIEAITNFSEFLTIINDVKSIR